jgi:hypothetical protein
MNDRAAELVRHAVEACADQGHEWERLHWWWYRACIQDAGDDGRGIVALVCGVANMGVLIPPHWRGVVPDPAGEDWAGRPARSGKHWPDGGTRYPYGGVGIAHFDRTRWDDLEKIAGEPCPVGREVSYDQALQSSKRGAMLRWVDAVLGAEDAHVQLAELWLRDYWRPASAAHPGDFGLAAVNARIRNSASGIGASAAGKPLAEQVARYRAYKLGRSQSAADRAMRQVAYAKRAGVLEQALSRFGALD